MMIGEKIEIGKTFPHIFILLIVVVNKMGSYGNEFSEYSCAFCCDYAETTNLKPFLKTVKMIKSHWTGINNYNESKINNIILEGINSKVQLVKKICCRFSNLSMNSKKALL